MTWRFVENMAEAAHAEAPRYAQFPYDRAKAAVFGQLCLTHPDFMLLIAEKGWYHRWLPRCRGHGVLLLIGALWM